MRDLGVDAYRFSIAWPRVVPGGDGAVNAGRPRLLRPAGGRPAGGGHHARSPRCTTGICRRPCRTAAAGRSARPPSASASTPRWSPSALGDRVNDWVTLNEPLCSAWIGHLEGRMAPGLTDLTAAVRASLPPACSAHGLAVAGDPRGAAPDARVGIVNNLSPCEPATDRDADVAAARRADGHTNRWWLDPIHGRGYPQDMVELYGVELPVARRRPGGDRRAAGLARPELLLPAAHRRRPRPAPPRTPGRSACPACRAPRWTGRSTPTAWSSCCCG